MMGGRQTQLETEETRKVEYYSLRRTLIRITITVSHVTHSRMEDEIKALSEILDEMHEKWRTKQHQLSDYKQHQAIHVPYSDQTRLRTGHPHSHSRN